MGKYLDKIRDHQATHEEHRPDTLPILSGSETTETAPLQPGDRITWQGSDGKRNDAVIDFLHAYPGEVWAFCTLPDGGWSALNTKYLKREDATHD